MSRSLVIAITAAESVTGGIAEVNRNILRVVGDLHKNCKVEILSLHENNRDRPKYLPPQVKFSGCEGNKLLFSLLLIRYSLRRSFFIFDHVTLALPVLPFAMVGILKTMIVAHGSESWQRVRPLSRWSFRTASLILANSGFTKQKMEDFRVKGNIVACPLGLSPDMRLNEEVPLIPAENLELMAADGSVSTIEDRMLLLVARIHPGEREKGHDQILEVAKELATEFPDVQFVFAGPGEDRDRLASEAKEKGVGSIVFLPGRVAQSLLEDLFQRCYAYVMPSRQEGFGLVHLEAMNFGKACLACRNDGAADVVLDEETGILVSNPDDRKELLVALRKLLLSPDRTNRLGRAGFRRLHENFTSECVQERFLRHFELFIL